MQIVLPMKPVSLNVDLGELPDEPDELYRLATMVNIACGGHTGDPASMQRALVLARDARALIAAHPSYPDRPGFGRTTMTISVEALEVSLRDQMAALAKLANDVGVTIEAVKPHGALYHDAANSADVAEVLLRAVEVVLGGQTIVVGPPAGALREMAASRSRSYLREGFADRAYLPDGRLVPRSQPNALITDPAVAAAQALLLAQTNQFDTLCVHGDTSGALTISRAVRKALSDARLLERRT